MLFGTIINEKKIEMLRLKILKLDMMKLFQK